MREVAELLVDYALSTSLISLFLAWDERHLMPDELARAWPVASRRVAIFVFGVICLPVHFGRTRRSFYAACWGAVLMFGIASFAAAVANLVAALFPP